MHVWMHACMFCLTTFGIKLCEGGFFVTKLNIDAKVSTSISAWKREQKRQQVQCRHSHPTSEFFTSDPSNSWWLAVFQGIFVNMNCLKQKSLKAFHTERRKTERRKTNNLVTSKIVQTTKNSFTRFITVVNSQEWFPLVTHSGSPNISDHQSSLLRHNQFHNTHPWFEGF